MMVDIEDDDEEETTAAINTAARNSADSPNLSCMHAGKSSKDYSKNYSIRGILAKKGMGKIYKPWTLRNVFVDLNQTLAYFDGSTLKGEILLDGVTVRHLPPEEADGRRFAFEISNIAGVRRTQDNVLILGASSQAEAQEWVDCLKAAASSTVRARAMNGPGYMSLSAELKENPSSSSDMENIKRLRELRQQQKRSAETQKVKASEGASDP